MIAEGDTESVLLVDGPCEGEFEVLAWSHGSGDVDVRRGAKVHVYRVDGNLNVATYVRTK